MIALALAVLLAAPPTVPWVERDGASLRLSADVTGLFDDDLRRRLRSGLSTTLRLRVELRDVDSDEIVGFSWRVARVRWDLWDERLTAVIETPAQVRTDTYADLNRFATAFAVFDGVTIALGVAADQRVYRPRIQLEVNPVSAEQMARMRRWLSAPDGQAALDPFGSGLLGSFVRLFDNLKPGAAERVLTVDGVPARADRLPPAAPGAR